jgi:hypothetical protein
MRRCTVLLLFVAPLLFARQPTGDAGRTADLPLLLSNPGVRKELSLTPTQIERIDKLNAELRQKMIAVLKEAQNTKDVEKVRDKLAALDREANTACEKLVVDLFKPDQLRRLRQIELQTAGIGAFSLPEVRKRLNLSEKQTTEVRTATEKARQDGEQIRKEAFSGGRPDQDKMREVRKKTHLLNQEAAARIIAAFTDEQKQTWTELTGTPFELKLDGAAP